MPTASGRLACLLALPWLLAGARAGAQELVWSGEMSLASELAERGLAVWRDQPVAQGVAAVSDGARWSAALGLAQPLGDGRGKQVVLRGSAYWTLSEDWQWQARGGAYAYPGLAFDYDHGELGAGAAWRDNFWLGLSATRMRHRDAHWYPSIDLGLRWPLGPQWSVSAGWGRAELPAWPDLYYRYADLSLAWQAGRWGARLSHLQASHEVRRYLGDAAGPRTALTLTMQF